MKRILSALLALTAVAFGATTSPVMVDSTGNITTPPSIGLEPYAQSAWLPRVATKGTSFTSVSQIPILFAGDSLMSNMVNGPITDAISASLGVAGWGIGALNPSSRTGGAADVSGAFTTWLNGFYENIPAGGSVVWDYNTLAVTGDTVQVAAIKEVGAGKIQIAISTNGGGYVDAGGLVDLNAASAGSLTVRTTTAGSLRVRITASVAAVKVIGCGIYSSTTRGMVAHYICLPSSDYADWNLTPAAIVGPILAGMAPDMVAIKNVGSLASTQSGLPTFFALINTACGYTPDWEIFGLNPMLAYDTAPENGYLRQFAVAHSCSFVDLRTMYQSYAAMLAAGLISDGTHPTASGQRLEVSLLMGAPVWRWMENVYYPSLSIATTATLPTGVAMLVGGTTAVSDATIPVQINPLVSGGATCIGFNKTNGNYGFLVGGDPGTFDGVWHPVLRSITADDMIFAVNNTVRGLTLNGTTGAATFVSTVAASGFSGSGASLTSIPLASAVTGQLPIANGGTAASTASGALANLGVVLKTLAADETRTSTTTVSTVTGLSFSVVSGETWVISYSLWWHEPANLDGGIRVLLGGPSASNAIGWFTQNVNTGTPYYSYDTIYNQAGFTSGFDASYRGLVQSEVTVTFSASGTVVLQAAQLTSDVDPTTLYKGSFIKAVRQ